MADQNYNKAYEAYQQAVYRDGKNPTFWCSIGVLYYQINQFRDALDAYSRAIRLNPYISEVWFDLGSLYESCNNQIADAIDAYARAAELDPENPHIQQRLQLLRNAEAKGENVPGAPMPQDVHPTAYSNDSGMAPGPPSQIGGPGGGMTSQALERGGGMEGPHSHLSHRSAGPQLPAADKDREGLRSDLPGPGSLPHSQSRGPTPPPNERGDHGLSHYRGGGPPLHLPFDERERERGGLAPRGGPPPLDQRGSGRNSPGSYPRGGGRGGSNSRRNSPARSIGNGSERAGQYGGRDNRDAMDWERERSRGSGRASPDHHPENGQGYSHSSRGPIPAGGSSSYRRSPPTDSHPASNHRRSDGSVHSAASNDSHASKSKHKRNTKTSKESDPFGNGNGNGRNPAIKSPPSSRTKAEDSSTTRKTSPQAWKANGPPERSSYAAAAPPRRAVDEDYDDGDSAADALMGLAGAASAEADAVRKSKSNSEEKEQEAKAQAQAQSQQQEAQEKERIQQQQQQQEDQQKQDQQQREEEEQRNQKQVEERQKAEQETKEKQQQEESSRMEVDPPAAAESEQPTKQSSPSSGSSVLGKRQASEGKEDGREADSKRARNGEVEKSSTSTPAAGSVEDSASKAETGGEKAKAEEETASEVPASSSSEQPTSTSDSTTKESKDEISTKVNVPESIAETNAATTATATTNDLGDNQKEKKEAGEGGEKANEAEKVSAVEA